MFKIHRIYCDDNDKYLERILLKSRHPSKTAIKCQTAAARHILNLGGKYTFYIKNVFIKYFIK